MKILTSLSITLTALKSHKTRTLLASLGIVIGIASVIIMVAIGKGSQKEVMDVIASMGENLITIQAGEMKMRGGRIRFTGNVTTLKVEDALALSDEIPDLERVAPFEIKPLQIKFGAVVSETNVAGTNLDFPEARNYSVARGQYFDAQDFKASRRVTVLGVTAVKNIFGEEDPIGQTVRVQSVPFKVIGVFESKGLDTDGRDQDDIILIPLTTLLRRILNQDFISTIYVKVNSRENIPSVAERIKSVLRQKHKLADEKEADFSLVSQLDLEDLKRETAETFTRLIVGVAAISLVVGGIGILAVMLISVKERTREIGVRRAVGATRSNVINQFILESLLIGVVGGFAGVAFGVGITLGLRNWGGWILVLDAPAIFISSGVCMVIGILFGIYPALKASRLDPMESLTVE